MKLQEGIALRNLERCIALLKTGSGTQLDADNAENQLNNIRADLKVLEANLLKTKILAPFSGEIGFSNFLQNNIEAFAKLNWKVATTLKGV